MNGYRLLQYLKYRLKARGRHGVHSPFVYRFIEESLCLHPGRQPRPQLQYADDQGRMERFEPAGAMRQLLSYFRFHEIVLLRGMEPLQRSMLHRKDASGARYAGALMQRLYYFDPQHPDSWDPALAHLLPELDAQSVVAVSGIHHSPAHTAQWNVLCRRAEVPLSIDLFDTGLLFFNPDFKEKQHFVLKHT